MYLEKSPDSLMDIAHRKPKLLEKLFSKFPDLLIEPLELNPLVLATVLNSHKELLHAIPLEELELDMLNRFRKFVPAATQTGTNSTDAC